MAHERRRAPRCPLIASVEVIAPQSDAHIRARISDLSLVGCYLDTINTLPVGTEVRLNIAHNDATFSALGVVAHSQPNMGIGVRFTDVQLDQHAILERWLADLVRD
ncbi:MAG: PilZ domain-containing protein [Candidatus Acidiferrales bacterium]